MSKREYFVSDLVIDDDYDTISGQATIKEAALLMKEKGIPDIVVLRDDDTVEGVVADYDIVIGTVAAGKNADSTKVVESMYRIDPVKLDTPVEIAFYRMQELDVSAVPVVDDVGKLLGIVTITDCWGYLPDKYEDYKGLLTVSNPRLANYWFTVLMTVLYFFFGIFSPVMGFAGFLTSNLQINSGFSPAVTYYLFDARGGEYFIRYLVLKGNTLPWIMLTGYGIIFVIVGIVSTILILQWAYADYSMLKQGESRWHSIATYAGITNILVIWFLYYLFLSLGLARVGVASLDPSGFSFSIVAILFLLLAVNRDFFFKQKVESTSQEGSS